MKAKLQPIAIALLTGAVVLAWIGVALYGCTQQP